MWLIAWALYSSLILASGIYHTTFVAHSHWEFVKWIPPLDEVQTVGFWLDIVVNLLLYIPFALLYLQRHPVVTRGDVPRILLLGLALSCTVELYQLYSHNRRAAPSDIVCNVTGTWLGVLIHKRWGTAWRGLLHRNQGAV